MAPNTDTEYALPQEFPECCMNPTFSTYPAFDALFSLLRPSLKPPPVSVDFLRSLYAEVAQHVDAAYYVEISPVLHLLYKVYGVNQFTPETCASVDYMLRRYKLCMARVIEELNHRAGVLTLENMTSIKAVIRALDEKLSTLAIWVQQNTRACQICSTTGAGEVVSTIVTNSEYMDSLVGPVSESKRQNLAEVGFNDMLLYFAGNQYLKRRRTDYKTTLVYTPVYRNNVFQYVHRSLGTIENVVDTLCVPETQRFGKYQMRKAEIGDHLHSTQSVMFREINTAFGVYVLSGVCVMDFQHFVFSFFNETPEVTRLMEGLQEFLDRVEAHRDDQRPGSKGQNCCKNVLEFYRNCVEVLDPLNFPPNLSAELELKEGSFPFGPMTDALLNPVERMLDDGSSALLPNYDFFEAVCEPLERVLNAQRFSPEMKKVVYVFVGRGIEPKDKWQTALWMAGIAGAGKSVMIELFKMLHSEVVKTYENQDTVECKQAVSYAEIIQPTMEKTFGPGMFLSQKPRVLVCEDATPELLSNLGQDVVLNLVSQGSIRYSNKYGRTEERIACPSYWASNQKVYFTNTANNISRRFVTIMFLYKILDTDAFLIEKLFKVRPAIMVSGYGHYLEYMFLNGRSSFWVGAPYEIHQQRSITELQSNPIGSFIAINRGSKLFLDMARSPDEYCSAMPLTEFWAMLSAFCSQNNIRKIPKMSEEQTYLDIFRTYQLMTVSPGTEGLHDNVQAVLDAHTATSGVWVMGIEVLVRGENPVVDVMSHIQMGITRRTGPYASDFQFQPFVDDRNVVLIDRQVHQNIFTAKDGVRSFIPLKTILLNAGVSDRFSVDRHGKSLAQQLKQFNMALTTAGDVHVHGVALDRQPTEMVIVGLQARSVPPPAPPPCRT